MLTIRAVGLLMNILVSCSPSRVEGAREADLVVAGHGA